MAYLAWLDMESSLKRDDIKPSLFAFFVPLNDGMSLSCMRGFVIDRIEI